jgi:hypothetical protein
MQNSRWVSKNAEFQVGFDFVDTGPKIEHFHAFFKTSNINSYHYLSFFV